MMVATTTDEVPKTVWTQEGKPGPCRQPATCVIPTPSATDIPTTVVFRGVIPSFVKSLTPVIAIWAKTERVAPPITLWGMVVSRAESLGIRPAAHWLPLFFLSFLHSYLFAGGLFLLLSLHKSR